MSWNERTRPARRVWEIDLGWDVVSADGQKIGEVADVRGSMIMVEKGFLFKTDLQIPVSAIADVAGHRVYLLVAKDEIEHLRWDADPARREAVSQLATDAGPEPIRRADQQSGETVPMPFPLAREEPQLESRPLEQGRARPETRVREEEQSVDVPLRREVIRVERRLVSEPFGPGKVPAAAFHELDIEIPIRGEEAIVRKQAVLREEVRVQRELRPRDEQFAGTVHGAELPVEPDAPAPASGPPPRA